MSWSDLTITREDIDSWEKQSFRGLEDPNGALGIDADDGLMLSKAKRLVEADIIDYMQDLLNNGTYANDVALLDALESADDDQLLKDLLTFKFLEMWFRQDATNPDSKAMIDSKVYNDRYVFMLRSSLARIAGRLSTPQSVPRIQFRSTYGRY